MCLIIRILCLFLFLNKVKKEDLIILWGNNIDCFFRRLFEITFKLNLGFLYLIIIFLLNYFVY
jgi:hypothetical protein